MNLNIKKFMSNKTEVVVFTKDGDKLIGYILSKNTATNYLGVYAEILATQEGIFLKRKDKVSFLGLSNIKSIRPAKFDDKEIDNGKTLDD